MKQVLHITAHMGGGVGKVLSKVASYAKVNNTEYQHKIILLEAPEKMQFVDVCIQDGVEVMIAPERYFIEQQIRKADIIQLEWWHHPKMAQLLAEFPQIPLKLIIWSHISGCNYPIIPFEFIQVPHRFLFTSKYSLENPFWSTEQQKYAANNASVIHSSGGFTKMPVFPKAKQNKDAFYIGYVGTLSYSKLNPEFIDYCVAVDIPEARFILVGDNYNQSTILRQATRKGLENKIEFAGYSTDVVSQFARFDVFGYLLNPDHFGTTENVLLEAMAFGLPVVALNQAAEKYLIKHGENGLLANNIQEYAEFIRYLYDNPSERERMGKNASQFVLENYAVEKTVASLESIYKLVDSMSKQVINFEHIFGSKPYEWFLACLGHERNDFIKSLEQDIMSDCAIALEVEERIRHCRLILQEESKSSICHFKKYFSNDEILGYWDNLINCGEIRDRNLK